MAGAPENFYRGKWQNVKITEVGKSEDTPLDVRKSLVGLTIPTIFTKEQIEAYADEEFLPEGSRLAYSQDVIEALKSAGKDEAAKQLENVAPDYLDMYVLEREIYELV